MSAESSLKERLSSIKQNNFKVSDEAEVWPLALQMMQFIGTPDPELRDKLIYDVLCEWSDSYFDGPQLGKLLDIVLDEQHLFYGLGEQETDSVFTRSFSSLAVASFVFQHRARPFMEMDAVSETLYKMVSYLSRERDLRGYVPGKGWAHAAAHAADALDELAMCPEVGVEGLWAILRVIDQTLGSAPAVFAAEEDERLVTVVMSAAQRQVLDKADIAQWTAGLVSFEPPPTFYEWYVTKINLKHFLRSLYFRAQSQGVLETFEPVLSQTLQEIHNFPIPARYRG